MSSVFEHQNSFELCLTQSQAMVFGEKLPILYSWGCYVCVLVIYCCITNNLT